MAHDTLQFFYRNKCVSLTMKMGCDFYSVFFNEDYLWLNVCGETVIDIGANIGDSALYFAISGAKKVIALEPYPFSYELAKKNIEDSDYKNIIEILNAGYGKDEKIQVDEKFKSGVVSPLRKADNGKEVNLYSLKTLTTRYKIQSAVLKMDCEGCEYNLLNEEGDTIRKFHRIIIEYHHGYVSLVQKLRELGYKVNYTEPKNFKVKENKESFQLGMIYASLE
ncbi:MAG: FkbM family methyltransferase [Candidatus Micrarchaeaceae archaeon]